MICVPSDLLIIFKVEPTEIKVTLHEVSTNQVFLNHQVENIVILMVSCSIMSSTQTDWMLLYIRPILLM